VRRIIPVFFACDNNYVPFLAVAIKSMLDNASKDNFYNVHILTDGLLEENINKLKDNMTDNSRLIIDDMNDCLSNYKDKLLVTLRDYYSLAIFFRLFIAQLYPDYDRAIYLDSDIVVLGDISCFFDIDLENNVLGAIVDDVIYANKDLRFYVNNAVGINYKKYFNSGVLLIDLNEFRAQNILEKFLRLVECYNFETIVPDQDYLNILCENKVKFIDKSWDRMAIDENYSGDLNLIHYNNYFKPWNSDGVPYARFFWQWAEKTNFFEDILKIRGAFDDNADLRFQSDWICLLSKAKDIAKSKSNFKKVLYDKNCFLV